MKTSPFLCLFLLAFGLTACVSPFHIYEIEVLEPAHSAMPPYLNKIGVLVKNAYPEKDSFHLKLEESVYNAVSENLAQSPLVDTVILIRATFDLPLQDSLAYNWANWEQLSLDSDMDGFIFFEIDKTKFSWVSSYGESFFDEDLLVMVQQKDLELKAELSISFYLLNPYYRSFKKQTLDEDYSYTNTAYTSIEEQNILQDSVEGLAYVAWQTGEKYAHDLAPWWQSKTRFFFKGNGKLLKNAFQLAEKNELDEAAEIWLQITRNGENVSDKTLAKAFLNLALYYEIMDRLDEALSLASQAYDLSGNLYAEHYLDELQSRVNKKQELDKQLKR